MCGTHLASLRSTEWLGRLSKRVACYAEVSGRLLETQSWNRITWRSCFLVGLCGHMHLGRSSFEIKLQAWICGGVVIAGRMCKLPAEGAMHACSIMHAGVAI